MTTQCSLPGFESISLGEPVFPLILQKYYEEMFNEYMKPSLLLEKLLKGDIDGKS